MRWFVRENRIGKHRRLGDRNKSIFRASPAFNLSQIRMPGCWVTSIRVPSARAKGSAGGAALHRESLFSRWSRPLRSRRGHAMIVTKSGLARLLHVSPSRVSQWLDLGMPERLDGRVDVIDACEWCERNLRRSQDPDFLGAARRAALPPPDDAEAQRCVEGAGPRDADRLGEFDIGTAAVPSK